MYEYKLLQAKEILKRFDVLRQFMKQHEDGLRASCIALPKIALEKQPSSVANILFVLYF